MQVDINLLPHEKSSSSKGRKMMFMLIGLFITGIVGITTYKVQSEMEIVELEKQVEILQDERSRIEEKRMTKSENDLNFTKEMNQLLSDRIATTDVIDEVTEQVQNGSLVSLKYKEEGTVTVVLKFPDLEPIASYQRALLESEGISDVVIRRVAKNVQDLDHTEKVVDSPAEVSEHTSKAYFADVQISFRPKAFGGKGGEE